MFVLGTAGHIDHGKTALVRSLTGIDCDRLEEEKRRGITIELGFAPLKLSDGKIVSIIDVPGHERFVRQMVSGAAGVDAAMLVIAANEGVMPQTKEHLDILNILGVKTGLVALTKKDLVDNETLELAVSEAADIIRGSCLEDAAIIPVSAVTGEGVEQIQAEIENVLKKIQPRKSFGAFFMPIDRVFSKKGFGTVVTGTSYQGSITAGEEVEIMPRSITAKARSLETHSESAASVQAGLRVAINLASVSQEKIERGDAVCAKNAFIATDCFNAYLNVLSSAPHGIKHWQRVRLHVGTSDVVARISLLDINSEKDKKNEREIPPGSSAPVQILSESKIVAAAGQHFVIRFYSPLITIGGGKIMLPNVAPAKGRAEREAKTKIIEKLKLDFNAIGFLAAIVHDRGIINISNLFMISQMDKNTFEKNIASLLMIISSNPQKYGILEFGSIKSFISNEALEQLTNSVLRNIKEFHAKFKELAGIEAEQLHSLVFAQHTAFAATAASAAPINLSDFKEIMKLISLKNNIDSVTVQGKICYKISDFNQSLDKKLIEIIERINNECCAAGFNLVKISELEEKLKIKFDIIKRAIKYLRENEELGLLEGGVLFPKAIRNKLIEVLSSLDEITVASLRDAIDVNRKQSFSMLDYLDTQGFTRRDGDKRILTTPNSFNKRLAV